MDRIEFFSLCNVQAITTLNKTANSIGVKIRELGLWVFNTTCHFEQYFSNIVEDSFIGGESDWYAISQWQTL